MTVKELIEKLLELPQDLPVYTGTAYDNDTAYVPATGASVSNMSHIEAEYHDCMFESSSDYPEGVVIDS